MTCFNGNGISAAGKIIITEIGCDILRMEYSGGRFLLWFFSLFAVLFIRFRIPSVICGRVPGIKAYACTQGVNLPDCDCRLGTAVEQGNAAAGFFDIPDCDIYC